MSEPLFTSIEPLAGSAPTSTQATVALRAPIQRAPEPDRAAWAAARRKHITATDFSKLLGIHPREGALSVWLDKTGRPNAGAYKDNLLARRGHALEPFIISEVALEMRKRVQAWPQDQIMVHPRHPLIACTPDALFLDDDAGLEAKAPDSSTYVEWGPSWSDEYPERYLCQVTIQLACSGRRHWYLTPLLGRELRFFDIPRDVDLEEALIEEGERFWRDYVVTDREPPPDASEATRMYLTKKYPDVAPELRPATEEEAALIEGWAQVRRTLATAKHAEEQIKNQLRAAIGPVSGLLLGKNRVKFGPCRGRVKYAAVIEELNVATEILEKHRGEMTRQLRPSGPLFPRGVEAREEE